jgi:RimJ/RimL family protein N-acetyltransferase
MRIALSYTNMDMDNAFQSARLVYRAPEENDEDITFIYEKITLDPAIQAQAACKTTPGKKKEAENYFKYVANESLLGVIICIRGESRQESDTKPVHIPIGILHLNALKSPSGRDLHSEIGIQIAKDYQSQGYGTEALNWALDWAFRFGGLHRVGIESFSFNTGATRLYRRLGFTEEGRVRQEYWFNGEYHDKVIFGMLEDEWRRLRKNAI